MNNKISIIGAPMHLGQSRHGVSIGPFAIRHAGLIKRLKNLNYEIDDLGDIMLPQIDEKLERHENKLRNLTEVAEGNHSLAKLVDIEVSKRQFPLILGGDHSIAIGSLAGISKHYKNLGVIWYDAHGDLNSEETSPSGNIHGMPLAASLGIGHEKLTRLLDYHPKVRPENIVIIGVRNLNFGEKELIKNLGIKVYTIHEIDRLGMLNVMEQTIEYLKERTDGVHLSLDVDGLDPFEAPGVGTPVLGGLTYRESHLAMEILAESNIITSAEVVEVNPILDIKNTTAEIAVGLVASLLGERLGRI